MISIIWQRLTVGAAASLMFSLPLQSQQTAPATDKTQTSSSTEASQATNTSRPADTKKQKHGDMRGKKKTGSAISASGPPTAVCKDGTYSHDKPSAGAKGGKEICKANGGVQRFF